MTPFEYFTTGTCAKKIAFSLVDNKVRDLRFFRGCEGNLKTLAMLLEGADADDVVARLRGVQCGTRGTSCSDQLALAIIAAKEELREGGAPSARKEAEAPGVE